MYYLRAIRRLNLLIAGGLSGSYFWSNLYYLSKVKDNLELKLNGLPVPVPPKIKNLVYDVMKDMSLTREDQALINCFLIDEFDVKHFGYLNKYISVLLGVPQHFALDKILDFDIIPMVDNANIDPKSSETQNFNNFISLSMDAKKFAVARELYEAQNVFFYVIGLLPLAVIFQANFLSIISEKIFKSTRAQLPLFHAFLFFMSVWLYVLFNDVITTYKQALADLSAAKLGASYVDGGIEYYEKTLKRNQQLRRITDYTPYTEDGELKKFMDFRTLSMPYKKRIMLLNKFKQNKISDDESLLKYVL